jgi:hypothetical protein
VDTTGVFGLLPVPPIVPCAVSLELIVFLTDSLELLLYSSLELIADSIDVLALMPYSPGNVDTMGAFCLLPIPPIVPCIDSLELMLRSDDSLELLLYSSLELIMDSIDVLELIP